MFNIIILIVQQNYFSDQYPVKILNLSAKSFFPCGHKMVAEETMKPSGFSFCTYVANEILLSRVVRKTERTEEDIFSYSRTSRRPFATNIPHLFSLPCRFLRLIFLLMRIYGRNPSLEAP